MRLADKDLTLLLKENIKLSDTPSITESAKSKAETLRRAVYAEKIWVKKDELWEKLYAIQSKFKLQINQYLILQRILMSGETKGDLICITDARFESKQSLADALCVEFESIKYAERTMRKRGLIVSSGAAGKKNRKIAVGQDVIEYLLGHSKGVCGTPLKGYPVPLTDAFKGVSATTHSIETRSIESSRGATTNLLLEYYARINTITGVADPKVKNKIFLEMRKRHGRDGFNYVLELIEREGVKFIFSGDAGPNEIHHKFIGKVFEDELKRKPDII